MRPEDFIFNTDFQSIANVSSKTYRAAFGGQTVPALDHIISTIDIAVDEAKTAMAQYLISRDGQTYFVGPDQNLQMGNVKMRFEVHRIAKNKLRATLIAQNSTGSSQSYPALTFWVRESLFNAPDMV
jgi:hypothetical protein